MPSWGCCRFCRTPPTSDLFDSPFRSRFSVVSERLEEGERELGGIERLFGERGDGFFHLYSSFHPQSAGSPRRPLPFIAAVIPPPPTTGLLCIPPCLGLGSFSLLSLVLPLLRTISLNL